MFFLSEAFNFVFRIQHFNYSTPQQIGNLLAIGSNNAFVTTDDYEHRLQARFSGKVSWAILDEKIISDHIGFGMRGDNPLYEPINIKVFQLLESGITGRIIEYEKKQAFGNITQPSSQNRNENKDKIPLSMYHLESWFYIFLLCSSVSMLVFMIEFLVSCIQLSVKKN